MTLMESLARQTIWAGRNLACNLAHVPTAQLRWKPSPTAKSALEVANHAAEVMFRMSRVVDETEEDGPAYEAAEDLASAQALVIVGTERYAAALRRAGAAGADRQIQTRRGEFALAEVASMPVMDLVWHLGQVVYIQTLLGDEETYLAEECGWGTILRGPVLKEG